MNQRRIDTGGIHLNLLDWGREGLPPLFLLHGLASTSRMFDLIAEALAQHHHVLAFDQRGHGLSDKPAVGYDFETVAGDLDRLAHALGVAEQPFALAGHSWGAYTALYYAATRPGRVAQAALIDGGIHPLRDAYPTWDEAQLKLAPPTYHRQTADDIKARVRAWLGDAYRPATEALALSVFDLSDPNDVHAHLSRDNHWQILRAIWEFTPSDHFARVRCPLLTVHAVPPASGQPPPSLIARVDEMQQHIAQAQVVWMENTSHDIPWHRPAELSAILSRFLA